MQYYIEFNIKLDIYFESSVLASAGEYLDSISERLDIKSIFEYFSYHEQNDLCPPGYEETEIPWFDPQEGIDWLATIIEHVQKNYLPIEDSERLVQDLTECQNILHEAKSSGARWHFAMDI